MGRREQENRKRKASAQSFQSLGTWISKVPGEELSDTDNDNAVCDDFRSISVNYSFTARYRR